MGALLSIVRDARAWRRYYDTQGVAAAKDESWLGRLVATESVVDHVMKAAKQPVVVELNARLQEGDYNLYDRFRKDCMLAFGGDVPKKNEMKFAFLGTPEGNIEPLMTTGSPIENTWAMVQEDRSGFSTSIDTCLPYCGEIPDERGDFKLVVYLVINPDRIKFHRKVLGARWSYHSLPVAIARVKAPQRTTSYARKPEGSGTRLQDFVPELIIDIA